MNNVHGCEHVGIPGGCVMWQLLYCGGRVLHELVYSVSDI